MKKLNKIILIGCVLLAWNVFLPTVSEAATEKSTDEKSEQHQGEVIAVKVKGLVCDFCAQSLHKTFKKQKTVTFIKVSLDDQLVTIYMKPKKTLSDKKITKLMKSNGFNVVSTKRSNT